MFLFFSTWKKNDGEVMKIILLRRNIVLTRIVVVRYVRWNGMK